MSANTVRRLFGAALFASLFSVSAIPASAQGLFFLPFSSPPQTYQPSAPDVATPDAVTPGDEADGVTPQSQRQIVSYPTSESPGTIIVDTPHAYLYFVLGGGRAIRYGIGVGRQGFAWSGVETISRKAEWPDWVPPAEMVARQPYLPRWVAGGPGNPLGARALYLGHTDYRIHGTNDPTSIGKHMSSGCIRLLNADIIDLYNRAGVGTKVIVLPDPMRQQISSAPRRTVKPQAAVQQTTLPIRSASRIRAEPLGGIY